MSKPNHVCPPTGRGSALLLTTILLFVVLSLVVSLSYITVMEQQMSSKTKSSVGSFFNADSGVEWALNKIANSPGGKIAA
ncbi:MAG: PilX N-terminal domain-containing pilus assembly protein, partial [Candidatus Moranbacteria bacterium]|nr:PilX N-terminal domain-containing pilus assembly protein [Candidatus Moranbacteria bacterium]